MLGLTTWNCDFDSTLNQVCDMVQSETDNFQWTLKDGATRSRDTGPSYAADGMYYMYIEASTPRIVYQTAE